MKKIWLFILWLYTIFFAWNFIQAKDYEYTNLDITANILVDGTIDITEDFTANFFISKHWIIRDIPLNYSVWWNKFHIEVSNINVQWKPFKTNKSNWSIEIKIWDADRTVVWEQKYPISYKAYGLIRNFSWMWYAELYWNLVWYNFDTNIKQVRAELILPKTYTWFTSNDFLITTDWITNTVDWFMGTVDYSKWDRIIITYDKWLYDYQWITLAIKFPNNYFEFDHERQAKLIGKIWNSLLDNLSFSSIDSFFSGLGLLGFFALSIFMFIKNIKNVFKNVFKTKTSKIDIKSWALNWDFAKQFPVIVQYTPPVGINSAEAWLLLHRKAEAKDMLSLIYKRAAEWLITLSIEEWEKPLIGGPKQTVVITKIWNIINEKMPGYEQDLFRALVRTEKNKIEESSNLYNRLGLSGLESFGQNKWRFKKNKSKGGLVFLLFIWACFLLHFIWDPYPWLMVLFLFLATFCIFLWKNKKLKESEEWAKLISHILWYREFLAKCDENKLKLFLQQDPLYFDKILPYAVAFWLETELLKKIEPIMKEMNIKSNWYDWNLNSMSIMNDIISSSARNSIPQSSSYSSSRWFSGWSSFWWGFSSWWGGGWWGGRSW